MAKNGHRRNRIFIVGIPTLNVGKNITAYMGLYRQFFDFFLWLGKMGKNWKKFKFLDFDPFSIQKDNLSSYKDYFGVFACY